MIKNSRAIKEGGESVGRDKDMVIVKGKWGGEKKTLTKERTKPT